MYTEGASFANWSSGPRQPCGPTREDIHEASNWSVLRPANSNPITGPGLGKTPDLISYGRLHLLGPGMALHSYCTAVTASLTISGPMHLAHSVAVHFTQHLMSGFNSPGLFMAFRGGQTGTSLALH